MPDSVMTLFPHVLSSFEALKMPLQAALAINQVQMQSVAAGIDIFKNNQDLAHNLTRRYTNHLIPGCQQKGQILMRLYQEAAS